MAHFLEIKNKWYTPCGTQTHNPQIRSLMRYSIAPTGRIPAAPRGPTWRRRRCRANSAKGKFSVLVYANDADKKKFIAKNEGSDIYRIRTDAGGAQ